jgi:hypothetical protein
VLCRVHDVRFDICTGGKATGNADRFSQVMCAVGGHCFPGRNSISLCGYDICSVVGHRDLGIFVRIQEIRYLCVDTIFVLWLDTGISVSLCGYRRFGIFVWIRFANVFINM